jgi:hypothetical protein
MADQSSVEPILAAAARDRGAELLLNTPSAGLVTGPHSTHTLHQQASWQQGIAIAADGAGPRRGDVDGMGSVFKEWQSGNAAGRLGVHVGK